MATKTWPKGFPIFWIAMDEQYGTLRFVPDLDQVDCAIANYDLSMSKFVWFHCSCLALFHKLPLKCPMMADISNLG